ncbi:hypothetical protein DCE79_08705 [Lysinibacillus sp. 2017]|uniref:acyltransferase n=1 Tax=unclassified Lysinibacillus TaxID=2636778 RepID=UPI000D5271AD|nr:MULTISPECIES: acyltransferase [unclassified Lysinibacillus]AWE07447.1 hypothetical protein DCE79_08705 [Lysinibacillus sp. 2017]TGN36611.1 acyltransferase [Lysinibacillus sp. S2017]
MKRKLEEVQFARAFAMFAVLFVHFSSTGLVAMPAGSDMFYVYSSFNTIGKLGVPAFFFLSGLVLLYSYRNKEFNSESIKAFYVKRLKYIILPYISISIFYFVAKWFLNHDYTLVVAIKTFVHQLFTGKVYMHLYFMFVLIQFYLVFPFILYVFKKFNLKVLPALIGSILIQFTWYYLNRVYFGVESRGSYFLSYFSFFVTGAAIGFHYARLDEIWHNSKKLLSVLIVVTFLVSAILLIYSDISIKMNTLSNWLPPSDYRTLILDGFYTALGLTGGLMMIWLGKMVMAVNNPALSHFLNRLAIMSFGIYLFHPFFLFFARELLPGTTPLLFHSWQIITAIIVTAISWIFTHFVSKNKYGWLLIGK